MSHIAKPAPTGLLILLAVLQAGCLLESDSIKVVGECGPRDLTPECCLKENPDQWERCTGSTEMAEAVKEAEAAGRTPSLTTKLIAAGVAVAVALQPQINSAESRGTELAADLLAKVEKAIVQCVRKADREVNDYHFKGKSPTWEICQEVKVGEQTTWAAYLGLFKHEQSWPCLQKALDKLLPKDRYLLRPRFRLNEQTGKWEYLNENEVRQIVTEQGWKGLKGTIEPDIILMDEKGFIVHLYDLKFPCPETNPAVWRWYKNEPWEGRNQGALYKEALQLRVTPKLVSPRLGVEPKNMK
ncbi:hypothetical protein [Vitiosangium sp. GDMCC 1.1324]|uniref:hypothetical protein n=1 Tax=Vitiosangium sp. (strain GDMCC 1.1324) TaxID=2138576 RepID=UPI000D3420D6|nr:hypothetical protein [Vitiosangium sp. GDMCC 1.1324]PTL79552.1 hypothetical protein DAT35_32575 [Vitiosangium sp. GDMCC 1.1324]